MFTLDEVVPWGRSFSEYQRMFALTEADFGRNILGCGDGPAAFNAEASRRGVQVVSCDPLYQFSAAQIRQRIDAVRNHVLDQTQRNHDTFVWTEIADIEQLAQVRTAAMECFLADYEAGRTLRRYVEAALPALPFADGAFDLAICSHLLFLYSDQLSEAFHRQSIKELCRVAGEVRIFPLQSLACKKSPHLGPAVEAASQAGFTATVKTVPYEFQRGANQMLRMLRGRERPPTCH